MKTGEQLFNVYNEQGPKPWKTWNGHDVPRWADTSDQVRAKWNAVAAAQNDKELEDVREFMRKFGQLPLDRDGKEMAGPHPVAMRKLEERFKFLKEELEEFEMNISNSDNINVFAELADALVDLVYVAKGTALLMGLPWNELWNDVQRANMAKVRGVGKRGNLVDCIKPVGWEPPHGAKILRDAGFDEKAEPWDDPENTHASHGRGTEADGPDDSDCPCRKTERQDECAKAGCGFCLSDAVIAKRSR